MEVRDRKRKEEEAGEVKKKERKGEFLEVGKRQAW